MTIIYLAIGAGVFALAYAALLTMRILKSDPGTEQVQAIGRAIQEGAMAFLSREYRLLAVFVVFMFIVLAVFIDFDVLDKVPEDSESIPKTAISYLAGAIGSGLAGFIGMSIAVRANTRTTVQAQRGLNPALRVAFNSGAVMGVSVVGIGLIGITVMYWIFKDINVVAGFGFGASSIALFARVGGGIYTKAADVGADLVGKVEAGLPEDDPRNPAVVADLVGDNVGDCAGMAADLFETYAVTMVGTMLLAAIFFTGPAQETMMAFPLVIGAVCILGSVIATWFVRLGASNNIMGALYKGFIASAVISGILIAVIISWMFGFDATFEGAGRTISGMDLFVCAVVGLVVTGLIVWITEYYTGTEHRPVKSVAAASVTGDATNIIQGLAISMEATALPVIVICGGIIAAFMTAGLFGLAIAATTMLALAGMVVALDAFGPVTDNAGGIAEMAELPEDVRNTTDALDAVGNTTKAVTKGYAIGSAGFAALVLFAAYTEDLKHYFPNVEVSFNLQDPYVVVGLFIGGLLPFLFGAMGMMAVGRAGGELVVEIRRQFKEIPGIMEGTGKPEYAKCVDMLTKSAIKEMIIPSMLPVFAPVVIYFVINVVAGQSAAFTALGAMLLGSIVTGLFVAISMTSGGGAWDNAKKYIEDGNHGGKGSDAHKAAVTGDTVGDPYKDTAGPAVNPMIKIINIVAILLLAILA